MTDLAKRLAEGPGSRELSDEVLLACGWSLEGNPKDVRARVWRAPDGKAYDWWDDPHARSRESILRRPNPTESVDDALALVPEGWSIQNIWESVDPKDRPWWGCNLRKDEPYRVVGCKGIGGDNPLPRAICIAVLGAKERTT